LYLGFVLAVASAVLVVGRGAPWIFGVGIGIVVWFVCSSLFVAFGQSRFGERPDAEQEPLPTYRRMWSRVSDRFLFWMMMLGIVGTVGSVIGLVGSGRSVSDVITLVCGVWIVVGTGRERRTRQSAASTP
jgi:hypothetical protein